MCHFVFTNHLCFLKTKSHWPVKDNSKKSFHRFVKCAIFPENLLLDRVQSQILKLGLKKMSVSSLKLVCSLPSLALPCPCTGVSFRVISFISSLSYNKTWRACLNLMCLSHHQNYSSVAAHTFSSKSSLLSLSGRRNTFQLETIQAFFVCYSKNWATNKNNSLSVLKDSVLIVDILSFKQNIRVTHYWSILQFPVINSEFEYYSFGPSFIVPFLCWWYEIAIRISFHSESNFRLFLFFFLSGQCPQLISRLELCIIL